MGLMNLVTMKYFRTVISNLKDTLTSKIESALEVHIGSSEPTSESYKVWIDNKSTSEETNNIPFVNDTAISSEDTWSSQKITNEIDTQIEESAEVYVGDSEPGTDSSYKVWVNETKDSETIMIPFVDDENPSADNTYSSQKIENTINPIKDDINFLMGVTEELSKI